MGTALGYNPHWPMLSVFKILLTSDRDKMESAIPAYSKVLSSLDNVLELPKFAITAIKEMK